MWEQYHYSSAERLHPTIAEAVRIFQRDGMWQYGDQATQQLLSMSLGAMKPRCTKLAKQHGLLRGVSTTKVSPMVKAVPVFFGSWKNKGAGHGQVDTVVHCGERADGEYGVYGQLHRCCHLLGRASSTTQQNRASHHTKPPKQSGNGCRGR